MSVMTAIGGAEAVCVTFTATATATTPATAVSETAIQVFMGAPVLEIGLGPADGAKAQRQHPRGVGSRYGRESGVGITS